MRQQFPENFLSFRHLQIAAGFTALIYLYEFLCFPVYYSGFNVPEHLLSGFFLAPFKIFAMGLASFFLTVVFVLVALVSPYKYRLIYFLLFVLGVIVEYGYQNAFNRFTNLEDVMNAFTGSDARMISSYISEFYNTSAVIPCLAFGVLLAIAKPVLKTGLKPFLVLLLSFGAIYSLTSYFTTNVFPSGAFNSFCRTVIGAPVNWYFGSIHQPAFATLYSVPRREVSFRAAAAPRNNIVFIVDESVRGDHLSLNGYARPTTPFLDELHAKGLIKNWGIGVSGTTCSINSNNLLLTGVNTIPDREGGIFLSPTVFQYAKAAGYKTFYFDGQLSYRWLGKQSDVQTFDEWITADKLKKGEWHEIDAEIARRVREIVGNSTGNFIWINKFGVHFPYFASYPQSETPWLPIPELGSDINNLANREDRSQKISNNYDNAIFYNSQSFFKTLLGDGLPENTFFVYTSDHGQNLGEDGRLISHCSDTPDEAAVPIFIIADPRQLPETDTNYRASHANLFPALLDLMNVPESPDARRENYSISLFKAKSSDSKPREFYSGSLSSESSVGKHFFDK